MSLTVISAHDFIFPFKYAQVESGQTLPAKHVYEGWKRAIQSGKNPRTGRDLTPKEVQRLQSKISDYDTKLNSGAIPKEPTPPPAPPKSTPPITSVPQEPDYTVNRDAEPSDSASAGHLSSPTTPTPALQQQPQQPQQQPQSMSINSKQFAKLLHDPALAKQVIETYRSIDPDFSGRLERTLQKYQWAANPQQAQKPQEPASPALTPPPAASFQSPEWASPEMGQQMQDMYNQNQKMKQFNDWAVQAKQQGFTDDQINQLKSRMNQPMNQPQMFPYNYQAPQQNQAPQRSFWQDVGRGAGFGAGVGGGGGWAAGGPVGMVPGAAAGGLLGGLAGGARNLYNRGKRLYDDYLSLQKNPNQTWNQIRGRTASSSKFIKIAWDDDDALDFMSNLNEEDAEAFAYFINTSQGIVPQPASSYL